MEADSDDSDELLDLNIDQNIQLGDDDFDEFQVTDRVRGKKRNANKLKKMEEKSK